MASHHVEWSFAVSVEVITAGSAIGPRSVVLACRWSRSPGDLASGGRVDLSGLNGLRRAERLYLLGLSGRCAVIYLASCATTLRALVTPDERLSRSVASRCRDCWPPA